MRKQKTNRSRTYITHLNTTKWSMDAVGFNTDGTKLKPKKDKEKNPPKKGGKVDEKQQLLLSLVDQTIKYMIKMRKFAFVMQTEKKNLMGIKVINQFYVDEKGNTISDAE